MTRNNRVRIIGGLWRGRIIAFPSRDDLRPTPDRVRETLFNWLGQDLAGKTCLDLFAGSGVLGFEAASRGARRVVMVEKDRVAYQTLRENAARLAAAQVEILWGSAVEFLKRDVNQYDVIFVDPPYQVDILGALIPLLASHAAPGAEVYLESRESRDLSNVLRASGWQNRRQTRAGKVNGLLLNRT
jgi:16S rRNA (guanine966-N2)-methyltransferase